MNYCNLVGPQIRRLRYARGWSQNVLAAKLQILGLDISRESVAKIESRLIHVSEYKLPYFAGVFKVEITDLFPSIDPRERIHDVITGLMHRKKTRWVS